LDYFESWALVTLPEVPSSSATPPPG